MNFNEDVLRLPSDQFSRQKIVKNVLESLRKKGEKFRILDVGGYKGATKLFYPLDDVTVLDIYDVEEPGYIKGDGTKLDFPDEHFDYVLNFDVLEHIPGDQRKPFINECYRVSKIGAIYAAPHQTIDNTRAEIFMNDTYKKIHKKDHRWLKEHIDYKLPKSSLIPVTLKKQNAHIIQIGSNYLPLWIQLQLFIFIAEKTYNFGRGIEDLYKEINSSLISDSAPDIHDNYRVVTVALKNKKNISNTTKNVSNSHVDFNNLIKAQEIFAKYFIGAMDESLLQSEALILENNILRAENNYINNIYYVKLRKKIKRFFK